MIKNDNMGQFREQLLKLSDYKESAFDEKIYNAALLTIFSIAHRHAIQSGNGFEDMPIKNEHIKLALNEFLDI